MSTLKNIIITSVKLGSGTSNKSGSPKPYQFANVTYLRTAKDFISDQHNIQMAGFETQEVNMAFDVGLYAEFKNGCPFLTPVDLILDADPENPARNIVSGFQIIDTSKKAKDAF
ncbi:MAG: hypothetical protein HRT54_15955 [Colwellia sp.]|nr:hypothetical protein [Colwellia sp.]